MRARARQAVVGHGSAHATPTGIRLQLVWAFLFMSAIPLVMLCLIAAWFAFPQVRTFYRMDDWFPLITNPSGATWWVFALIALTALISLLGGAYLAIRIIDPVIRINEQARRLAAGDYSGTPVQLKHRDDELGQLTASLGELTGRIRQSMEELQQFGQRTTKLNLEIHQRVAMLSSLLQISEAISRGTDLNTVLDLVIKQVGSLDERGFSFLCLQPIEELPLILRRGHAIDLTLISAVAFDSQLLIDAGHPPSGAMQAIWERLDRANLIVQPVLVRRRLVGVLGVGNYHTNYHWPTELVDLIGIFIKQASIALENEIMLKKTRTLAVLDELTGVYNERHVRQRLAEELRRAAIYQRPCALLMFFIQGLQAYRKRHGEPEAEAVLKQVARQVQELVTEVDRVGRFDSNELVVLLPERNKRQAMEMGEAIRRKITETALAGRDLAEELQLGVGVAENPLDGVTGEELLEKARARIRQGATIIAETSRPE